jgi:hypothetical protein
MITYFEYSDFVVGNGHAPASLCYFIGSFDKPRRFKHLATAERVYSIEGNVLTEIKNRNGAPGTMHISDEDKVVLILKAVLI